MSPEEEIELLRAQVHALKTELAMLKNTGNRFGNGNQNGAIDWSKQPLGEMPDSRLGAILGVSNTAVRKQRQKRGIPNYAGNGTLGVSKLIDYDSDDVRSKLGVISDKALARELKVDPSTVRYARMVRGINPATKPTQKRIDWDAQPLGEKSDRSIATEIGVNHSAVRNARMTRHIPPHIGGDDTPF